MLCQKALGYCDAEHSLKLPHDITELDLQNYVSIKHFKTVRIFFSFVEEWVVLTCPLVMVFWDCVLVQ